MPTFSQVDFIEGSRSWERAYFTTYALSLTFFESYILPRLRKAGCERVTVFVDSDGYRASLMERRSRSIGQEYALIPIESSKGIFHPKITYLCGEEGDVLLVGSGNLTFGGHGRNIECLEALEPDTDPVAFADFADFLELLQVDDSIAIADKSDLLQLRRRVLRQTAGVDGKGPTRLLHSLRTPILDQLIERAADGGPWKELICLSPFHHPKAKPIQQLATGLGVKSLQIGVPPSPTNPSSFPFEESRNWGLKVNTVAPRVSKSKRPLHAKWFELRGKRCLTLVGSTNATEQSIATIKNVEISVLREINAKGTESWKSAKQPAHEPNDFTGLGESKDLVLHAVLAADGSIDGQILKSADLAGAWAIWLRIGDQHGPKEEVQVDKEGRFKWKPPDFNEFEANNSVQVNLVRDEVTARGWVSFQSILRLPSRSRAAQAAIARMLAREDSLDDCRVLLDYVAFHSNKLIRTVSPSGRGQPGEAGDDSVDETFSVVDLSAYKNRDSTGLLRDLASEALTNNRSWKTLSLIARLLSGRKLSNLRAEHKRRAISGRRSADDEETAKEIEATSDALGAFNEHLSSEFSKAKEQDRNLVPFLVVWLNVNLDMRLRHLAGDSSALPFCNEWTRRVVHAPIPKDVRSGLDESVFGVVAALALQLSRMTERDRNLQTQSLSPGVIHQWLETYAGGEVDKAWACQQAELWFQTETPNLLVDGESKAAIDALLSVLSKPTPRIYLSKIVEAHSQGRRADIPEDIFGAKERELISEFIRTPKSSSRHRVVGSNTRSCPGCHYSIHSSELASLRARRIIRCIHCKTILALIDT